MNTLFEKQQVKTKKKKTSIQLLLLHWIVNQPTDRPDVFSPTTTTTTLIEF